MTLRIASISEQHTWESFVLPLRPNTFLQSWEWGQVQAALGEGVQYLGIYADDALVGIALVLTVRARRGVHYLIPHGPLFRSPNDFDRGFPVLVTHLREQARRDHVVGLRIAPLLPAGAPAQALFQQAGFRPAPLHVHAELTWVLDTSPDEASLLSGMRKTTRHAIRRATKAGVAVDIVTNTDEALARFWPLYEATRQRHGFVLWPRSAIAEQLRQFSEHNRIFSVVAQHDGSDVAAAICPVYGDTVFYYHGASRQLPASVPATQALQWAAIQEAKRRGATRYNFWGIAPEEQPDHPFAGITTFKRGFGGEAIDYLHAHDLPFSLGYWKLWLVDSWRRWRRGF